MHGAVHSTIPNGRIAVESWNGVEQKSIYMYDPVMAWSMMGSSRLEVIVTAGVVYMSDHTKSQTSAFLFRISHGSLRELNIPHP